MPTPCSICTSPKRQEAEAALLTQSEVKVAKCFGFSPVAVHRRKRHIRAALAKSPKLASAANLIQRVQALLGELEVVKRQAMYKRGGGSEVRKTIKSILTADRFAE